MELRVLLGAFVLAWASFPAAWILFSALGRLAGARWATPLRRLAESAIGSVVLAPIGILLLAATGFLAAIPPRPDLGFWLTPGAIAARTLCGLGLQAVAAFVYVRASARADHAGGAGVAAHVLALRASRLAGFYAATYLLVQTILAFDLVMALKPHFRSVLLGAELAVTSFAAGVAGILVLLPFGEADWPRARPERAELQVRDLGALLAVLTLLGPYLIAAQLMTIWYGNLREETQVLAILGHGSPWHRLAIAALCLAGIAPFLLLVVVRIFLPRFARGAVPLALVAVLVVVGVGLERLLLVGGPLLPAGPSGLLRPAAMLGLGGMALHFTLSRLVRWRWRAMGGRAV